MQEPPDPRQGVHGLKRQPDPNERHHDQRGDEDTTGREHTPRSVAPAQGFSPMSAEQSSMAGDRVEVGVELLSKLEFETLDLAAAMDRIETVTTDPDLQRRILEVAEERGVIDREGQRLRPRRGTFVRFGRDVVTKEGQFACRRCGSDLSTGYFLQLDAGELGPFGSTCIRKVTGRD